MWLVGGPGVLVGMVFDRGLGGKQRIKGWESGCR